MRTTTATKSSRRLLGGMLVVIALAVAGCGGGSSSSSSSTAKSPAPATSTGTSTGTSSSASSAGSIPQGPTAGDRDADNRGAPSDGDGNL